MKKSPAREQANMKCFLNIFTLFLMTEGRDIQTKKKLEVNKRSCVEDVYQTIYGIPSLMQCASLCLNADICQSVTFLKMTGECRFSNTTSNTTCTLGDDDGTLTSLWFKKLCPAGEAFCNPAAEVYYEFVETTQDWYTAEQDCVNRGGRLAVLDTEDKFNWMKDLRMAQQTGSINSANHWIGLRDAVGDHSWTWVNDATVTVSHSGWYGSDPNHSQGDTGYCGLATAAVDPTLTHWGDALCSLQRSYICEYSF